MIEERKSGHPTTPPSPPPLHHDIALYYRDDIVAVILTRFWTRSSINRTLTTISGRHLPPNDPALHPIMRHVSTGRCSAAGPQHPHVPWCTGCAWVCAIRIAIFDSSCTSGIFTLETYYSNLIARQLFSKKVPEVQEESILASGCTHACIIGRLDRTAGRDNWIFRNLRNFYVATLLIKFHC